MLSKHRGAISVFGKYMQNNLPLMLSPINCPCNNFQQVRNIRKHWNPKFRKERAAKVIKEHYDMKYKFEELLPQDYIRTRMKDLGLVPQRKWKERPIFFHSTPTIFESYVVPEGDGKFSTITKEGAKQKMEFMEKKSKSYLAIRKIKSYDENFTVKQFCEDSLDIYKKAHEALVAKDENELLQHITETLYPKIMHNVEDKTIIWKFLESLEPARVVHARCTSLLTKGNIYAQATVRFHTQQILCIYDRFGRLLQGSEILKKDVLDYIVFEKHLSNEYGTWRMHGKIVPSWMPLGDVAAKTFVLPKSDDTSPESAAESIAETVPPEVLDARNLKDATAEEK
ncbi:PREDICTED: probable 39S ribosomal protein L45, mitochondrial [Dufourea novaeangliae]|uniref:Large ribosomal subunit protein mL45 n=1 Tax=Dufourea novaeangliae TaxID=178035 RepID=A0A154P7Y7_DUFNO|nr:PREDICTED: probable 39S ribosomal protein L45, mitochondrial [Dufourea novaeangliae]KZC07987.1 putative 39S ribosomal protein L45, mitochondrial [Dufourea novaeangliae]